MPTDHERLKNAVLLIIDLQKAIDHPSWGRRNNPQAEHNIARLLEAWRKSSLPIYHIRHLSREPNSTYRPGQAGCEFKPEAEPAPGEPVIDKHVTCAFIGTDLESRLRAAGYERLAVTGVITNNSVEATVRAAGDLGFEVVVVSDATFTFDKMGLNGKLYPAEDVHEMALANMNGEYARVADTQSILQAVENV